MDNSSTAENALYFAILLAQKLQARLLLVNAFQLPVAAGQVPFNIIEEEITRKKKESEQLLRTQSIKVSHAGQVEFGYAALEGVPDQVITTLAKSRKADYIVMGTTGESGLASTVFGSTAWHVMEKAPCPVIAIPANARFNASLKRIAYATDYRNSDVEAINKLSELAALWNAQLNVLHVDEDHLTAEQEIALMDAFRKKILERVKYNNFSFQILYGDDAALRLEEYIGAGNTDMLVMATHRRKFLERLFGHSVTRDLALQSNVPVMAFHYNQDAAVKIFF